MSDAGAEGPVLSKATLPPLDDEKKEEGGRRRRRGGGSKEPSEAGSKAPSVAGSEAGEAAGEAGGEEKPAEGRRRRRGGDGDGAKAEGSAPTPHSGRPLLLPSCPPATTRPPCILPSAGPVCPTLLTQRAAWRPALPLEERSARRTGEHGLFAAPDAGQNTPHS